MTTIVTPGSSEGNGGWAVAIVILILVIVGIVFVWPRMQGTDTPAPAANIEVNLPSTDQPANTQPTGNVGGPQQ